MVDLELKLSLPISDSSSSEPQGDDSISRGTKKQKIEHGVKILQLDPSSKQTSLIEHPAIAVNVVPLLELGDAFALGSCSKYLNGLCNCESIWKEWYKRRWGPLANEESSSSMVWKYVYRYQHTMRRRKLQLTPQTVRSHAKNGELNSDEFFMEIENLKRLEATFEDVYFLLLREDLDVAFNLIGIYYCLYELRVNVNHLKGCIVRRQLADRKSCTYWSLPKNWSYGFFMPEESFNKTVSLRDILDDSQKNTLFIFKQVDAQKNLFERDRNVYKVRVTSKIPAEPEPEPACDCEACKSNKALLEAEREKSACQCDFCKGNSESD